MGVDYRAGIAYGIPLENGELYGALEKYFNKIQSPQDLPLWWNMTDEYFVEWKKEYNFSDMKDILYEDEILLNIDAYSGSGDYILGYVLDCVDWGCKTLNQEIDKEITQEMRDNIYKWYKILFPEEEKCIPELLLYSQVW